MFTLAVQAEILLCLVSMIHESIGDLFNLVYVQNQLKVYIFWSVTNKNAIQVHLRENNQSFWTVFMPYFLMPVYVISDIPSTELF